MAVVQYLKSSPPTRIDGVGPGEPTLPKNGGIILERLIGLPGAALEWPLILIRIALAISVLVLAFVQEDMQFGRHSGRIWCRSEKGKGAIFSFSIPFEVPAEETIPGNVPADRRVDRPDS
jgi:hypothetical protein